MTIHSIVPGAILMLCSGCVLTEELKIKVKNIDIRSGGNIIVMVFSEEGFPIEHEKAIFTKTQSAQHETMVFTINIEMDELAVKVLHDEDMDGKTTKNWTGIWPREGLGFSNDQKLALTGPPKYRHSKLSRGQWENGVTISVLYP